MTIAPSEISIDDIIEEIGYSSSDRRTDLSEYFNDVERAIQKRINRAEAEISRKTGRYIDANSPDWASFQEAVVKLAAIKALQPLVANETTGLTYDVSGGVEVDRRSRSKELRALIQQLKREVNDLINLLKITQVSTIRGVYSEMSDD